MQQHYDFIAIGSGPAGRRAAVQSAKLGRSTLVVERGRKVGGVSVHTGTIPSKTLRETVLNLSGWRERGFYGRSYRVKKEITTADLIKRLHITLNHEVEILEHQFARNRVDVLQGAARFLDPNRIEVAGEDGEIHQITGDAFLLSVGTKPFRPSYVPFDGERVVDSDEVVELKELPRTLTVVGAGVIGIEYATIFSALDVRVTLVEPRNTVLDFIDQELVSDFLHQLRDRGMSLRLGCKVERVEAIEGGPVIAHFVGGRQVRGDALLFAAGRMGATDDLGLENVGLTVDHRGRLEADKKTFQTAVPHIYAAGDVIGFPSLASTSLEQGRIAVLHALGEPVHKPPEFFPYGIYAVPEMSTVGMSEEEVIERKIPYEVGITPLRETSRGKVMGLDTGMIKIIFSTKTRRLLGVHIVGEGATELIHIGQAVLTLKGTLDYFLENAFNYPTLAEAYKVAALYAHNRIVALQD